MSNEIPAERLVDKYKDEAALISKLIDPAVDRRSAKIPLENKLQLGDFDKISNKTIDRIKDAENLLELFPDVEMAAQILISSVLSPKDMMETEILYRTDNNMFPTGIQLKLVDVIKEHIEKHYSLTGELGKILRNVLFEKGTHIKVVIPENSLDDIVNSNQLSTAFENMTNYFYTEDKSKGVKSLGFLGNKPTTSKETVLGMEAFSIGQGEEYNPFVTEDSNIQIIDNFDLLKLPSIIKDFTPQKVNSLITPSNESHILNMTGTPSLSGSSNVRNNIYKSAKTGHSPLVRVKNKFKSKRKPVGLPLAIDFPPEACIPIHVPSDETNHIGYIFIIDEEGYPLTMNSNKKHIDSHMASNIKNGINSGLLQKAKSKMRDKDCDVSFNQLSEVYGDLIEEEIVSRLKNGVYRSNFEVGNNQDIYQIMLARSLSNHHTKLLYIPKELVTYFAMKHDKNGVGKSLLDGLRVLTSLRAILLFSKVNAQLKNAISLTNVNFQLDENDPDPQNTIEKGIHLISQMRSNYLPVGINSPNDLVDWLQKAGLQFTFEGHPGIPNTKFEFENKNLQHAIPDDETDENLRKQTLQGIGIPPETVDNGFSGDFATTIVSNNILLAKRVKQIQDPFMNGVTNYAKIIGTNDYDLRDQLAKIIDDEFNSIIDHIDEEIKDAIDKDNEEDRVVVINYIIDTLIDDLVLELPTPENTTLDAQITHYETYSGALEEAINAWISDEFMPDLESGEETSDVDITVLKDTLKAHFLRQWMIKHNYMSELAEIITLNDSKEATVNLSEIMKTHVEGINRSVEGYGKYIAQIKKRLQKKNEQTAGGVEKTTTEAPAQEEVETEEK